MRVGCVDFCGCYWSIGEIKHRGFACRDKLIDLLHCAGCGDARTGAQLGPEQAKDNVAVSHELPVDRILRTHACLRHRMSFPSHRKKDSYLSRRVERVPLIDSVRSGLAILRKVGRGGNQDSVRLRAEGYRPPVQ